MKSSHREPGDPTGAIDGSSMGTRREGRPERGVELRSEVGPARSTNEAPEGNEGVEGRGWREGSPLSGATDRTQSRVTTVTPSIPALAFRFSRRNARAKAATST